MNTAVASRTNRHLFKCPCKNIWKIESTMNTISAKAWYDLNNTNQTCPACGRFAVRGKLVVGTFNATKVCNARCMGATSPACECNCDGENHGASH
jgi:hypothetical protein